MTSLAFVLGMLPMVLASGPGSAEPLAIGMGGFLLLNDLPLYSVVLCFCIRSFFVLVYKIKAKCAWLSERLILKTTFMKRKNI